MRLYYSIEELICLYERTVHKAVKLYKKGALGKSLKCVSSAADLQYYLNDRYEDARLNSIVQDCSFSLHGKVEYIPVENVIFFYDSFGQDNRGLTQQYLDALVCCQQYSIIYILDCPVNANGKDIFRYCNTNNIIIERLPDADWRAKETFLFQLIQKYRPYAALFHITPSTFLPFLSFYPFSNIIKYQVNLTDHAFWLGAPTFFDYSYEFRPYGVTVSIQKRGFDRGQLILNPFYPWQSDELFKGFPVSCKEKVIIFSGGATYKIRGGQGVYFDIVKTILLKNPNVVFLYAGNGELHSLKSFITENHFENRMYLLGNRSDIDAVFKNCDIYLNTYPIGGGLMVQYAAINGKPILIYKCEDLEEVVCTKRKEKISFDSLSDLYVEASKLVEDELYRKERGAYYRSLICDRDDFRAKFNNTFLKPILPVSVEEYPVDYESFCAGCIERINKNAINFVERIPLRSGILSPKVIVNSLFCIPHYIFKRVSRNTFFFKISWCKLKSMKRT